MSAVGYAFLHESLGLSSFEPACPALIKPVSRIVRNTDHLAVPAAMATRLGLAGGDALTHLLFALKHEGVNLALLMEALTHLDHDALVAAMRATPGSVFVRKACYLWEQATGRSIEGAPAAKGSMADLFDPARYVTMEGERDSRWRIHFNGLGTPRYCATLERSPAVDAGLASKLTARIREYTASVGPEIRDRALEWAYLDETRSSFAIEREIPSEEKQRAFVALLHAAHRRQDLSEEYLVNLQATAVTNPLDRAVAFRTEQNYLQGPLRGAPGITYIPPPPSLAAELMQEIMSLSRRGVTSLDPLVAGAVASFGFVFVHPFMDGNGRLSRFLVHYALCQSGELDNGLILPVSIAMKAHEAEYLGALQQFSVPARARWQVRWIGDEDYDLRYAGSPGYEIYRYWDATPAVEFCFRMANEALELNLRENTQFLLRYDRVSRAVERLYDVRGSDLATLVTAALTHNGLVSRRRRDQFSSRVPTVVFDFIEEQASQALEDAELMPVSRRQEDG
ncbi:MAG: Fic family protein [Luteibacter sp.]